MEAIGMTAIDDQPAVLEAVETDARAAASPGQGRQLFHVRRREAGEFQQPSNDAQAELRPDAEARMLRRRGDDLDPRRRRWQGRPKGPSA